MIFDTKLRRGVMKRHLPGPKIVSFSSTSFDDFVATVKPMFFLEEQHVGKFGIANASGIPFEVNSSTWELQDFVKSLGAPSKIRLYLLHYPVRS